AEVRPQFQHRVGPEGPGEVEEEPTLLGGGARFCRRPETGAVAGAVGYVEQSLERPGIVEETQSDLVDPPEIPGGSPEALVDEVREGVPQESLGLAFGRRLPKPSSGGVFERRPARGAHLNLLYTSRSFCFSTPQLYRCLAWRQAARYGSGSARILRVAAAKDSGSTGSTTSPTPVSATTLPMPGESDPSTGTSAIMYSKSLLGRVV